MDLWFLNNPELLKREREAISSLQQNAEWLIGAEWSLSASKLCADVIIRAHDHDYELRLIYPNLFPQVPPTTVPLHESNRLSEHQYGGATGPLCLEWGPDNWHPEVTGAQVLESAYKLLDIENPLRTQTDEAETAVARIAPSRHALNLGQELRGEFARFYISEQAVGHLINLKSHVFGKIRFSTSWRTKTYLAVIHDTQPVDAEESWEDPSIPQFLRGKNDNNLRNGAFFNTGFSSKVLNEVRKARDLIELLKIAGYENVISINENIINVGGVDYSSLGILIFDLDDAPHFLLAFDDGDLMQFAPVKSDANEHTKRTPENLEGLSGKTVGIVGVGSAGSKIAVSLARMGVRRFYLVDYDIFLPENVERNALDWQSLGDHKVDGAAEALLRLGVDFEIEVSRTDITGQESTAVVSSVLDRLGNCDLMIDATAEPRVFNLLAAVASAYRKPLVWLEIYGGGFGGMIARSRPESDPDAQTMRRAYLEYCERRPAPENMRLGAANNYGVESEEGIVYTASDADVSIIAHHAARLAVDTALNQDSAYPYSMYLIGLEKGWVFEEPFVTIPLATAHLIQAKPEESEQTESEADGDHVAFIVSLLKKLNATANSG